MMIVLRWGGNTLLSIFKTRRQLLFENLALRQQLAVLNRSVRRPQLTRLDRLFWVMVSRVWSHWSKALIIVQPQTVLRWHRQGFRLYWTWKSRSEKRGHPFIDPAVRNLIRTMSQANPLWGAPRIHGELLKLDIHVSQATWIQVVSAIIPPPVGRIVCERVRWVFDTLVFSWDDD